MEFLYVFGVVCIQFLQESLVDLEWYLDFVNRVFNPYNLMEYTFPMVSAIDSVFSAQLLLSIAFGGWCNTMLKWILLEDRPFWWVRETTYYSDEDRPVIRQNQHTCETGPGSPSGHCAAAATIFVLFQMWCSHAVLDLGLSTATFFKNVPVKSLYFFLMASVSAARMYAGAHFPHQCILGALLGSLISPSLCLFVTDPFLLSNTLGPPETQRLATKHVILACFALSLSMVLAVMYLTLGIDIHWATRMAFRWCQSADTISIKTSPVYSLVQATSSLIGWAVAITPEINKFRHNTPRRNNLVAILTTGLAIFFFRSIKELIPNRRLPFYVSTFLIGIIKPYVYLRLIPKASLATYTDNRYLTLAFLLKAAPERTTSRRNRR